MSTGLAIAGVTALLKKVVDNNIDAYNLDAPLGGAAQVKTTPPKDGEDTVSQINLFLYRAQENVSIRNAEFPSRDSQGEKLSNPPLALNLYYSLTACGKSDFHSELLLGVAMQALHETATFSSEHVRSILNDTTIDELDLQDSLLADQFERIRVTPHTLNEDEHFRVWSAFQVPYRASVYYQVSVLLITATESISKAPPVLQAKFASTPNLLSIYPTLYSITYPESQNSAELGDTVTISGLNLDGTTPSITLSHQTLDFSKTIVLAAEEISNTSLSVTIPDTPSELPAGQYELLYSITRPDETTARTTKLKSLSIAPTVTTLSAVAGDDPDTFTFSLTTKPDLQIGQQLSLSLGSMQLLAPNPTAAINTFEFENVEIAAGSYLSRVEIDGIASHFIDFEESPPSYIQSQVIEFP